MSKDWLGVRIFPLSYGKTGGELDFPKPILHLLKSFVSKGSNDVFALTISHDRLNQIR